MSGTASSSESGGDGSKADKPGLHDRRRRAEQQVTHAFSLATAFARHD